MTTLVDNKYGLPNGDLDEPILLTSPREGIPPVIDNQADLQVALDKLSQGYGPIAWDAERASGFRYGSRAYLIQLRREGVGSYLFDPPALGDMTSLGQGLQGAPWILHSAGQDLECMRQVGLFPTELFDTEVAAQVLGYTRFGLVALCEQVLGLTLAKDHQTSDWSVRPLPQAWLRYAALDVELLTCLYEQLSINLTETGRMEWAQQEFAAVLAAQPRFKIDRWRKIPGAGKIRNRRNLAIVKELWMVREILAQELDLAPNKLLPNSAIIVAANNPPRNIRALHAISPFRGAMAKEFTEEWMQALQRVKYMTADEVPPLRAEPEPGTLPPSSVWHRFDPGAAARLGALRAAVRLRAEELGLSPEILIGPRVVQALAWRPPEKITSQSVQDLLAEAGARQWQVQNTYQALSATLLEQQA